MNSGSLKPAINPMAYTHICDHAASYAAKKRKTNNPAWASITDMSGRGFVKDESTLTKGMIRPRETIRISKDLDHGNRFFDDNRKILD